MIHRSVRFRLLTPRQGWLPGEKKHYKNDGIAALNPSWRILKAKMKEKMKEKMKTRKRRRKAKGPQRMMIRLNRAVMRGKGLWRVPHLAKKAFRFGI